MQYAMNTHFGQFGSLFITLCVVLFAFSSILGNFFYIQTGVTAIKDSKLSYYIVVVMTLMLVLGGSIANLTTVDSETPTEVPSLAAVINAALS